MVSILGYDELGGSHTVIPGVHTKITEKSA